MLCFSSPGLSGFSKCGGFEKLTKVNESIFLSVKYCLWLHGGPSSHQVRRQSDPFERKALYIFSLVPDSRSQAYSLWYAETLRSWSRTFRLWHFISICFYCPSRRHQRLWGVCCHLCLRGHIPVQIIIGTSMVQIGQKNSLFNLDWRIHILFHLT